MNDFLNTPLSRRAVLAGLALAPLGLAACSNSNDGGAAGSAAADGASGFTMLTASNNYRTFSEALTAAKPDVELSMVSYAGKNTTDYIKAQMEAEQCPDIVINTFPNSGELQKANLYDLSGESFTNNIRTKLLDDISVDGAVYLIPSNVSFFGPYYNETLFKAQGWTVPNSMAELEELVPQIKEAGITLAEVTTQ